MRAHTARLQVAGTLANANFHSLPDGIGNICQSREAAKYVVDKYLKPGQTIGLGTGLAVNAVIEEIAKRIDAGKLQVINV